MEIKPELQQFVKAETGVLIDGKITPADAIAVYNLLRPVIDAVIPHVAELEDAIIDTMEARAMKRNPIVKTASMAFLTGFRTMLRCPDDDDNTTQF